MRAALRQESAGWSSCTLPTIRVIDWCVDVPVEVWPAGMTARVAGTTTRAGRSGSEDNDHTACTLVV
jgi:hypothetical protein